MFNNVFFGIFLKKVKDVGDFLTLVCVTFVTLLVGIEMQ